MNKEKMELLKEVVEYNMKFWETGDLEKMVYAYSEKYQQDIWNPFKDYSNYAEVDPIEEYGEELIDELIANYKEEKGMDREKIIHELCNRDKVIVTSDELNRLSISEDLLECVMEELKHNNSLYSSYEDYRDMVDRLEEDFKDGNIGYIKLYCNEGWGVDIGFLYEDIDFEYLDVMVKWEDIFNDDIKIMYSWIS